jgi:hypothetical protein
MCPLVDAQGQYESNVTKSTLEGFSAKGSSWACGLQERPGSILYKLSLISTSLLDKEVYTYWKSKVVSNHPFAILPSTKLLYSNCKSGLISLVTTILKAIIGGSVHTIAAMLNN